MTESDFSRLSEYYQICWTVLFRVTALLGYVDFGVHKETPTSNVLWFYTLYVVFEVFSETFAKIIHEIQNPLI